jgi:hypothetical protein
MRRLAATVVLAALIVTVCPVSALAALGDHGCCRRSADCQAPRVTACCTAERGHAEPASAAARPATGTPAASHATASVIGGGGAETSPAVVACPSTHGLEPIAPLLRTCLRRI